MPKRKYKYQMIPEALKKMENADRTPTGIDGFSEHDYFVSWLIHHSTPGTLRDFLEYL